MKKLWKRFSDWLIKENSFWDSIFKWILCKPYRKLSLGSRLNENFRCLKYNNSNKSIKADKDLIRVPRVSELYQAFWIIVGGIWLSIIEKPILTEWYWVYPGICIVLYRVLEIFLFALKWLFVDKKPLENYRRSLAMFLVNMIEIALFFSIAYVLLLQNPNVWDTVVESFKAVFGLKDLAELENIKLNPVLVRLQIIISWFLYGVILANVLGSIKRKEK